MARLADKLGRRGRRAKASRIQIAQIPKLWFFTDPKRTPQPEKIVGRLPAGAVVVYRTFAAPDAAQVALALRRITRERRQLLLIGADPALAAYAQADGVHLPERLMTLAPRLRLQRPNWLITAAAHGPAALHAAERMKLDAAVVSAIFPSRSASARAAMGPIRLAALVRAAKIPVIGLGGVNTSTAPRLISAGAAGLAAIDGLTPCQIEFVKT